MSTTDATRYLKEALLSLEPGTQWGGDYANKPGYHNMRANLPSYDYSVCDRPPDNGGSSSVSAAVDWTFPDAQRGDYTTISKYCKRLLASGKDPNDPRLDGWREFYGQADNDSAVEGWDFRYGCAVSSDSSHLWHIHLSECRDQTASYENKDKLLSVLRGESLEDWNMPTAYEIAEAVWAYNIASSGSYSAKGAVYTTLNRTGFLANEFAPTVAQQLDTCTEMLEELLDHPASDEQVLRTLNRVGQLLDGIRDRHG